jgi:5-methyltetrahydrofolate--homocysteine methyltransferase
VRWVDEAQETLYAPGVFYCKDAFEGLETLNQLVDPARRARLVARLHQEAIQQRDEGRRKPTDDQGSRPGFPPRHRSKGRDHGSAGPGRPTTDEAVRVVRRSPAVRDAPVPAPPFWGYRTVEIPWRALEQLLPFVGRNELFRGRWGYTIHDRQEWARLVETELEPRLRALWQDAKIKRWLAPRAIYGYFPVQADGDDLVVYDPHADDRRPKSPAPPPVLGAGGSPAGAPAPPPGRGAGPPVRGAGPTADGPSSGRPSAVGGRRELVRFTFPRQPADGTKRNEERLCLADYFRPVESGEVDVAAFQVVTVGHAASEQVDRLRAAGEYTRSYEVHGVSVQAAEAMAEYVHAIVRRELQIGADQGKRYSWGYPACPDLADHAKLFQILPVADGIGVTLTEAFQLVPEQSTAALVVHHLQAKYFSVLAAASVPPERGPTDDVAAAG